MNNIIDFINTNRDRYVDQLKEYLAIPSISALPQHQADVRRCAEWTAEEMRRIGLENVRLIETPGYPVVYGDWLHASDKPTILFYGHYDVQPVDPVDLWESPPFQATVRDGEIYARGSADDKGQVFMHFKAIEAHIKQNGRLPVNMRIILEGEEEVGSANLDNFIKAHKDELSADVVVYLLRAPGPRLLSDRREGDKDRPALRIVRRRRGQPRHGPQSDSRSDERQRWTRQDSRVL
jgi:acetylornithine deacetylase/succinyl-diaminopimelate desuccinylase-like protein